nr:hypothetical protein [Tanacetum cinerariifolium]
MCCDDAYRVTPRVFALAGCDRLISEPLVIERKNHLREFLMWNQKEPEEDREEDPQENSEEECELKKKRLKEASESDSNTWPLDDSTSDDETDSELQSIARSKAKPKESEDTCESSVRPKLNSPKTIPAYTLPDFPSRLS